MTGIVVVSERAVRDKDFGHTVVKTLLWIIGQNQLYPVASIQYLTSPIFVDFRSVSL